MKLWAKIYINNKITDSYVVNIPKNYIKNLTLHLAEVCNELDVATPVVLSKHLEDITTYNTTAFLQDDFIEVINFDKFVVEVF